MRALLDVNVLIALFDVDHAHHRVVWEWLSSDNTVGDNIATFIDLGIGPRAVEAVLGISADRDHTPLLTRSRFIPRS